MVRYLILLISIITLGLGTAYGQRVRSNAQKASEIIDPAPVVQGVDLLAGVWEDTETHDLHTIKKTTDGYAVESIIDYGRNGKGVEKMDLVLSEWKDGSLKWGYFVPSTGYHVFFAAVSADKDILLINWANDDGNGNVRKGNESLKRFMAAIPSSDATDAKTPAKDTNAKRLYGKIYKISGNEIIVASRNPGANLPMGDVLYVLVNGEKVFLDVVFPMQTIAKCKLKSTSAKFKDKISLNAEVYK